MPSHASNPSEKGASSRQNGGKVERLPSSQPKKDGAAQKAAQDVAGLKDYVCGPNSWNESASGLQGVLVHSNWVIVSARGPSDQFTGHSTGVLERQ